MSKTVHIGSTSQFNKLLETSKIVVTDCTYFHPTYPTKPIQIAILQLKLPLPRIHADVDFFTVYADWCGPCKQIAPIYEQLSAQLSRPQKITFTKVDTEKQQEIAQKYSITAWVT